MTSKYRYAIAQILGGRENQEDSCAIQTQETTISLDCDEPRDGAGRDALTAVLCDGMGGHASGEIAAALAAERFISTMNALIAQGDETSEALLRACLNGNEAIRERAVNDRNAKGMGTTLVGIRITEDRLNWVSIGDSHLLLFRNGKLIKLNQDHSMRPVIDRMASRGMITIDEALLHPKRNALRSVLNGDDLELIDRGVSDYALRCGDIVLLASDGLDVVPQSHVSKILGPCRWFWKSPASTAEKLLQAATEHGGSSLDNTTVTLVRIARW